MNILIQRRGNQSAQEMALVDSFPAELKCMPRIGVLQDWNSVLDWCYSLNVNLLDRDGETLHAGVFTDRPLTFFFFSFCLLIFLLFVRSWQFAHLWELILPSSGGAWIKQEWTHNSLFQIYGCHPLRAPISPSSTFVSLFFLIASHLPSKVIHFPSTE